MKAKYDREGKDNFSDSQIFASLYVDSGKSPSNSFLQISSENQGVVDVGKTLSFNIWLTEPLPTITYQVFNWLLAQFFSEKSKVVARGIVVLSQDLSLNGDSAGISFTATNQMAPKARLIVYGIRPQNKEVLGI